MSNVDKLLELTKNIRQDKYADWSKTREALEESTSIMMKFTPEELEEYNTKLRVAISQEFNERYEEDETDG